MLLSLGTHQGCVCLCDWIHFSVSLNSAPTTPVKLNIFNSCKLHAFIFICNFASIFYVISVIYAWKLCFLWEQITVLGLCSVLCNVDVYPLWWKKRSVYPMPSLYFWMSFCLSSLSSTQYSLGMTKLDVIRHSGQDLQRKERTNGVKTHWHCSQ